MSAAQPDQNACIAGKRVFNIKDEMGKQSLTDVF